MTEYEVALKGLATLRLWATDPSSAAVQAARALRPNTAFVAVRDLDRPGRVWLFMVEPSRQPRLLEAEAV